MAVINKTEPDSSQAWRATEATVTRFRKSSFPKPDLKRSNSEKKGRITSPA